MHPRKPTIETTTVFHSTDTFSFVRMLEIYTCNITILLKALEISTLINMSSRQTKTIRIFKRK